MNRCIILLTIIFLAFFSSCANNVKNKEKCQKLLTDAHSFMNEYYFTDDENYLDSAITRYNLIKKSCDTDTMMINFNISQALFLKRKYDDAIEMIDNLDSSRFSYSGFKDVFINKINAKKAKENNDLILEKVHYKNIVKILEKQVDLNSQTIDSILRLHPYDSFELEVKDSEIQSLFYEMYYYKSKVMERAKLEEELDSLRIEIGGNEDVFLRIKEMIYSPDGYQTMFE